MAGYNDRSSYDENIKARGSQSDAWNGDNIESCAVKKAAGSALASAHVIPLAPA